MKTFTLSRITLYNWLRNALLLIAAMFVTASASADDINAEQALQIASQFADSPQAQMLSKRRAPVQKAEPMLAHSLRSKVAAEKCNVYVVNLGDDQGFVVVSGETGADAEVLGYCDHGTFSYEDCPIQLKSLLAQYSDGIDSLRQHSATATHAPRKAKGVVDIGDVKVGPLLTTTWNQWAPYNNYCPEGCPAGCYPVALGQVMYYWKWPQQSQGYLNTVGEFHGEDFSGHVYEWDNMLDHYGLDYMERTTYNATQAEAVAKLLADIGTAFNTDYAPEGSSTPFAADPLVYNFGYEADFETHQAAAANELLSYLKADLDLERPILYCGGSGTGFHALVCDGYTTNDYFHFNYGWGGEADGYYKNASCGSYGVNSYIISSVRPYDAVRKVIDGIDYALLRNGKAEIWDYKLGGFGTENGTLIIPSTVTDGDQVYDVTRIRQQAFYRKGHFNKIIVGDNLEVVDPISFFYTRIDTLVLGDNLKAVPDNAFAYTDIRHLTIGKSISRIGKRAFYLCYLNQGVVSNSPAFEVGEEAFASTRPKVGEWLNSITSLSRQAFAGANFGNRVNQYFTNLEVMGDSVFYGANFGTTTPIFRIYSKVREIAPSAFDGWSSVSVISVDEDNPYLSVEDAVGPNIYDKNKTTLLISFRARTDGEYPLSLVKLAPRCMRPGREWNVIPFTVVEMSGAFEDCSEISDPLKCLAVVPPVIPDGTFEGKISQKWGTLLVPKGTEAAYHNAPGWRYFREQWTWDDGQKYGIVGNQAYNPAPAQEREYYMVVESSGDGQQRINIPVSEVSSMKISDDGRHVIISRNGKDDITTTVASVDSITWMPGFVYENAEVFNLNDSTLTVDAQKCSVRFDATCIDEDVQLCIRNSVLTPQILEDSKRGFGIDLSLSNGEHELSGTVDITIPYEVGADEKLHAAYFNEETGEWEPVYFEYDEQKGTVLITTSHLSRYTLFITNDKGTKGESMELLWDMCPQFYLFNEATKILLDIVSSDDPDKQMINQFKDDMSFWQGVGLDMVWNVVRGSGEALFDFRPELIDNAVTAMGYLGTAISIVNVAAADIKGDDLSVASGTLSTILNFASSEMAAAIGTPIMSVSMGGVAFIGIALNKFGTMMAETKLNFLRRAYYLYYSKAGSVEFKPGSVWEHDGKNGYYRTTRDWYNYFYPVVAEGKMDKPHFDAFVEASVREYCDRFWHENTSVVTDVYSEIEMWGHKPYFPQDIAAEREKISNEHFADLMNGELVSVFTAIRNRLKVEANDRYLKAAKDVTDMMNTKLALRFNDSSCKKGEKSKFAGWKIAFSDLPAVDKPEKWSKTIDDQGRAGFGWYTVYSIVTNNIKTQITLYNENDVEYRTYSFQIPDKTGKVIIDFDLAKDGAMVPVPKLKDLELTYNPDFVEYSSVLSAKSDKETGTEPSTYTSEFSLNGYFLKNARLQREIEKFFKKHDFISIDEMGNFKIGDDLVGRFEGETGTGKFTMSTTNPFTEQSLKQWVESFNKSENAGDIDARVLLHGMLDGTLKHNIECEFTLTRTENEGEYLVSYTGSGTYELQANVVAGVDNLTRGATMGVIIPGDPITSSDVTVRQIYADGNVTLKYAVKLKNDHQ